MAIAPTIRRRDCANCGDTFETPHGGDWPAKYCSSSCHQRDGQRAPTMRQGKGFAVHPVQRAAVAGRACLVCAEGPADPAHLIDRSLVADLDEPLAVVPLCRNCHRAYDDDHSLDLLPHLEPRFREHLGFAVARHGLLRTLERITNQKWTTTGETT